jgi:hypothetical protein
MNILICYWGLSRGDISISIDNYLKMFEGHKVDFLLSTWDDQEIDESRFKYILKHKSPTKEYLDEIKFPYTQQIKFVPAWHGSRLGHYAQFYNNYKIYEFINNNDLNYDVLVKTRTDLVFSTNIEFDFTTDMCYVPEIYWPSRGVGINDHFILGKFSYLKKALKIDNFQNFFHNIENNWNPESVHQKLILDNDCKYSEFHCSSYLLLPDRKLL